MADKKTLKKVHSTPGVYFSETELTYSQKSLGVTRLGVVGETQKGPAFQPINISDWGQFQSFFGGTSTEKFRGSQYPKYELPYIAKEYLTQSQELQVCRVLGLSGVNAGPAWFITAYDKDATDDKTEYTANKPVVIAVLRSRGVHTKATFKTAADTAKGICNDIYEYDGIKYFAKDVAIKPSQILSYDDGCNPGFNRKEARFSLDINNYGLFTLEVTRHDDEKVNYSVSLNPGDKNYILSVLGQSPEIGDSEIFVEELYDISLEQLIRGGKINTLAETIAHPDGTFNAVPLQQFPEVYVIPNHTPVDAILTMDKSELTRRHVGKRFLYSAESVDENGNALKIHVSTDEGASWTPKDGEIGHIYTVVAHTTSTGTREYYYGEYQTNGVPDNSGKQYAKEFLTEDHFVNKDDDRIFSDTVEVLEDGLYYVFNKDKKNVKPITLDVNNYREQYRYASTPWIVSELKGSATDVELTKLFRFHTISDGNTANTEVKISIENIDPDNGTFDVLVRDYNDSDSSVVTLEKYKGCNLIPGSSNYIAYKIGSTDESYETKSKYITVEVNENDKTKLSIPAGFLGYPVRDYDGYSFNYDAGRTQFIDKDSFLHKPYLRYNTNIDEDLRLNKQYFGLSDLVGIDSDIFKYKGVEAYNELPSSLTPCFHLDARIFEGLPDDEGRVKSPTHTGNANPQRVTVDGQSGYQWITVGAGNTVEQFGIEPRIGTEADMMNTIYEDKRNRKFTLCFYGGWDGWDYYRESRSNTDDFVYRKYRGKIDEASGIGMSFNLIRDTEAYGFDKNVKAMTSDYYAYLSAIRMFANPKTIDINHLATPGIDYVNNHLLVGEVIEMIEEERGDSVYVVTTPDKPYGMSDNVLDMYAPSDAVDNLEDSEIDSSYVCSSYPWNKYYDAANSQYIYLPPTKDMVRNFAYTDNVKYPWYAAVGWKRGAVNAISPKKSLKLSEQDELYDGRLNFTNTFAQDGLRLWGDKNFQKHESPMNRVSHRRALNRIKSLLSKACVGLLFDPNDKAMSKSLESTIKPVLDNVKTNRGLVDYKLVIDDSAEARDRLELNAQVYLKLMPNLEYINITLAVLPSGMQISDV